jgi:Protein of unknown function (DUF1549)/Protein of unknown function (DUF1553)
MAPWHQTFLRLAGLAILLVAFPWSVSAGDVSLRVVIDAELGKVWDREKITPAEACDDATFLRRVSLDLGGVIPTADEAKAFLDDTSADKRAALIERLLAHPRYGVHQADVWDMVFFGRNPPGYEARDREGFQRWLREAFHQNMHYDELARQLLKAEGNTAEQGAAMYLVQYDRHPEDAAMAVSQTFLGVQLQCARCHDHPHESWTQLDFYGMAAFFSRLQMVKAGKTRVNEKELDKIFVGELNTGDVKFTGPAKDAKPGQAGVPVKPKFLLASALEEPDFSAEIKDEKRLPDGNQPPAPKFSRKDKLAEWITSPENPYFARAVSNRLWAQFMGRGLVHPIDNMSESNPPSHPELLDAISKEFITHQFDVKWLIREILSSRAYQLDSTGEVADAMPQWFERARTRPLSAEELLESWRVATSYDVIAARKPNENKGRFYGVTFDYIRHYFGEPNNGVGDFQGGLHEHLYLNNGELGRLMSSEKDGIVTSPDDWNARVDRLYLAVLSRRPSEEERERFAEFCQVPEKNQQPERLREALWVLMTCSEFRFNH